MRLRAALPQHHLGDASKEVIKLGMGLVATMTALVLGLLTASAKSSFDSQAQALKRSSDDILLLDRVLAQYGEETLPVREQIKTVVARWIDLTWPSMGSEGASSQAS